MAEPEYKSVVDVPGTVGQFLLNTNPDDLIIELIQNDLDARSSRTLIQVLDDRLVCEGTGWPIKHDGWKRLKFILAAGGEVTPKRDGIGAKNHGLRVAFWIGDSIHVQSNGRRTQLTTRSDPSKARFFPGAWERAVDDPTAPTTGTRISILYRREELSAAGVEGLDLPTADSATADRLLGGILSAAPYRLIGVTHPTELPRFTLDLALSDGTAVQFIFSCRKVGQADGFPLLERAVERRDGGDTIKLIAKERAIRFPLRGLQRKAKVSWFFKGARGHEAEISWEIGPNGKPRAAHGALRYPITYLREAGAVTDYGLHLSAPFVSDQARHAPASGGEINREIIELAEEFTVRALSRYLVPKFGPSVLNLICSAGSSTPRTEGLIEAVGKLGGLPIVGPRKSRRGDGAIAGGRLDRKERGWRTGRGPMVVPYSPNLATTKHLAELLPDGVVQLHPQTPPFVVNVFASGKLQDICRSFTAVDAVDRMCSTSQGFSWASDQHRMDELSDPARMSLYLRVLSNDPSLVKSRAESIKNLAVLPIGEGGCALWRLVSRAASEPPEIPGVGNHTIIHPKLRAHRLLKSGPLALEPFNIESRLSQLDWSNVVSVARKKYLAWLVKHAKALRHKTLDTISGHPVFQAADGSFHPFEKLCRINDATLRVAMARHVKAPSRLVLALVGAKRKYFKLRNIPSPAEASEWYQEVYSEIENESDRLDATTVRRLDRIEMTMALLIRIADRALLEAIQSWSHQTVNGSGYLRPVSELHLPTEAVTFCVLADSDLLSDRPTNIWRQLGIREQPSTAAILRVIGDDADANTFFRRLSAYLKGGGNPDEIARIACVRTRAGMKVPSDVALRGRISYWGAWKTAIEVKVPERARNLRQIGVLSAELRETDSRQFFEWLSTQDDSVQWAHLAEIKRHWHARSEGPLRWWRNHHDVACLPTIAGGKLLLVSHRQAAARPVYLPDFPAINEQFARGESSTGVVHEVIVRVFSDLRGDGVPSLRDYLIGRGQITPVNPKKDEEQRHHEVIRSVKMGASGRRLSEELSRVGVVPSRVKQDFLRVMAQLSEIQKAEKIIVRYRVGASVYETETTAGLDENNTLWLTDDASDMAPFEALAQRLFQAGDDSDTAPYKLFLAVQAVRARFGRLILTPIPVPENRSEHYNSGDTDHERVEGWASEPVEGRGGSTSGHAPPKFEAPMVPTPGPFASVQPLDFQASGRRPGVGGSGGARTPARGSTEERRNTVLEEDEKTQLKRDNYAYHCQACLGQNQPAQLTPRFTYVWDVTYRARNIEAHHVEHLQNDGALGAGNLVILCEYHHDFLGDRLDRHEITGMLQTARRETRRFPTDVDSSDKKVVAGRLVKINLDVPPYKVNLFFTTEHADAWLARAKDEPD